MEEWRNVVGYEGLYQISDTGKVRRVKAAKGTWSGRVLKPRTYDSGHQTVRLYGAEPSGKNDGRNKWKVKWIHRMVLEAFIGPAPDNDSQANHKNGNPTDNRVDNLEWVTQADNIRHAYKYLGLADKLPRGEAHHNTTLTKAQVIQMRKLHEAGHSQNSLARKFGITQASVWRIVHRITWSHVN